MNLTSLFEKIAGKQQQRAKAKHVSDRKLVARIVDGKEPDAETVDRVLAETGKTLDDLRAAVELLQRRRQFREQYDRLPALADERQQVEQQIAAADRLLEEAERQHDEATAPLYAQLGSIKQAVRDGQTAERQLAETCDDQDLLAELQAVTNALRDAHGRRTAFEKETRELWAWAESDRYELQQEN